MRWVRLSFLAAALLAAAAMPMPSVGEEAAVSAPQRLRPEIWHTPLPVQVGGGDLNLAIYAIGFGGLAENDADRIARELAGRSMAFDALAVIDANDGSVILFDDGTRGVRATERRPVVYQALREHYAGRAGRPAVNLPASLQATTDIVRGYGGRLKSVNLYLLDALLHQSGDVNFREGYPNDGFILLDDSDFNFVSAVSAPGSKVHVFATGPLEHAPAYQRFATFLSGQMLGAQLATFSNGLVEGELPPAPLAPPDTSVSRSVVIRPDIRPVCPHDDSTSHERSADDRVTIRVTNPCRANSIVSFVANGTAQSVRADDSGAVSQTFRLQTGANTINLFGVDGVARPVFSAEVTPADDEIRITHTPDGAVLEGRNPLRLDDTEVTVRHTGSGRSWTTRARDDRWRLELPLSQGRHVFEVSRPGGGAPQRVDILRLPNDMGQAAQDLVNVLQSGGKSGYAQIILGWSDINDLDIVVTCPNGEEIWANNKKACGGVLDVDRNVSPPFTETPVENVVWGDKPSPGVYRVSVVYYKNNVGKESKYRLLIVVDGRVVFNNNELIATEMKGKRKDYLYDMVVQ